MKAKVKTPKTSFSCMEMLWLGPSCHMVCSLTDDISNPSQNSLQSLKETEAHICFKSEINSIPIVLRVAL